MLTARFEAQQTGNVTAPCIETGYYDVKGAVKRLVGMSGRSTSQTLRLGNVRYGTKFGIAARAFRLAADIMTYPDEHVGWLPFAVHAVRRILATGRYDAVLTTSPPVTTNLIGALGHGRTPWVADLRDLWAEDDSGERSYAKTVFDDRLERAVLTRAAALVASSELSAARFRRRYPAKRCYAVSTGYEEEEWSTVPFGTEDRCTLVYAGNFYGGKRDPALLFQALREILDERPAEAAGVRVDFFSPAEPWLTNAIAHYGLEEMVRVHGTLERDAVLAAERRADRLLVFSWDGRTAEGVVPGKLFEYFGARRPILAIGGTPRSAVQDLLRETGAGARCLTKDAVKTAILAAISEHCSVRTIPGDAVRQYTSDRCALAFSQILDSVVERRGDLAI